MNEGELFIACVQIADLAERAVYLDGACGGNTELRQRVEALLKAYGQAGSFLQPPAAEPRLTADASDAEAANSRGPTEGPGTVIGPYKLLEQIGEGGFGVVFMAEQTAPMRRKVALKILKPGMDTRQVVARFEAERQALAIMDHPNIAKVLDGGSTAACGAPSAERGAPGAEQKPMDEAALCASRSALYAAGRPYFVMELVKGVPITEFCDQNHLTPRQRLELFVPVCQAVQHAHQKGIIHRDLKPSNVLVSRHDTTPIVKVIDFGVAKALGQELTDKTLFTGIAQMIGTPLYMSPEQAGMSDLDVDTRSDIYSLGVLLYELLTGTTPFDKERFKQAAYDEIRRIIREEDPPKPSTRLSDTWRVERTAQSAEREAPNGKGASRSTLRALRFYELDWIVMKALEKDRNRRYETANGFAADVQRYLNDEPVQACPPSASYRLKKFIRRNKGPVLAGSVIFALLVGGIVGTTMGLVRALAAERDTRQALADVTTQKDRAVQAETDARSAANRTLRIGNFFNDHVLAADRPKGQGGLGKDVTIREALEQAAPKIGKVFAGDPAVEARVRHTFGRSYFLLGRYGDALPHLQRALELCRTALRPDHPDTLATQNVLAMVLERLGQLDEAEAIYRQTLEVQVRTLGPDHFDTLGTQSNLGILLRMQGKIPEAELLVRQTLAARQRILGPEHPDTLSSQQNLANVLAKQKKFAEAEALFREALKLRRGLHPDHPDTLSCQYNLALILYTERRLEEAEALLRQTLQAQRRVFEMDHPDTLASQQNLALVLIGLGKLAEAENLLRQTLESRRRVPGPDHPVTLATQQNLALLLRDRSKLTEAEPLMRQTLESRLRLLGPDNTDTLASQNHLAQLLQQQGKLDEAAVVFRELLQRQRKLLQAQHTGIAATLANLGMILMERGKTAEAEPMLRESLAIHQKAYPEGHVPTARLANSLGGCLTTLKKYAEAEGLLLNSLESLRAAKGASPKQVRRACERVIGLYDAWGKPEKAAAWRKKLPAPPNPKETPPEKK